MCWTWVCSCDENQFFVSLCIMLIPVCIIKYFHVLNKLFDNANYAVSISFPTIELLDPTQTTWRKNASKHYETIYSDF